MNLPKVFAVFALFLFVIIGVLALFKGDKSRDESAISLDYETTIEVPFEEEVRSANQFDPKVSENLTGAVHQEESGAVAMKVTGEELPEANRIEDFFRKVDPRLPIVETITYKSKVPWLKGRPAWVSDYASHYKTSRHFIARSLNGKKEYFKQNVALGDRFNVLRSDKDFEFYLVVDTSRSKMWFYYYDKEVNERVLIKAYDVGLGRLDSSQPSGLLTPNGHYKLGEKIAIYKPKQKGWFNNDKVEMIRVFGTRWIPFECEIEGCSAPAKGFGIHGAPWVDGEKGELVEDISCVGKYESDGCVRLRSEDIEELFAIVISRPTHIVLVKDFFEAKLPGVVKE